MKTLGSKRCGAALAALLIFVGSRPAAAANYSDGGTHTVSGADTNDSVSNGTTVNIVPGATVTGSSIDPSGQTAISVADPTSALNVSGGTIAGGSGSHFGASGLVATGGNFDLSGGAFNGGSSSGASMGEAGGNGALFQGYTSLTISGGTYLGGSGFTGENGYGVTIDSGSPTAQISGGTFGNGVNGGLHLIGASANVTAGVFSSPVLAEGASSLAVNGSVGGIGIWTMQDTSAFSMTSGTFSGSSLDLNGNATASIGGTTVFSSEINLNNSSDVTISGGQINREISMFNTSILNLTGGVIDTFIPTFYMDNLSVLNVYGTNLLLTPTTGLGGLADYLLSGTLANGTPITNGTSIEVASGSAVINLIQTPEPSTLVLGALALFGLVGWRRWPGAATR